MAVMTPALSPAGSALWNGSSSADPTAAVTGETDEQRRKRLAAIQQAQAKLSGSGYSPAGTALGFGGGYGNSIGG
jgi:hypothetical protein